MKRLEYTTKTGKKQYMPVIKGDRLPEGGWCLQCGHEVDGVEPDARRYICESCEQPKVYGIEELLLMGLCKVS